MLYRFTRKSRNQKTGPIPVTTTEPKSCPKACPLKGAGCYADGGPLAIIWRETADEGVTVETICDQIAALPDGQLWRHNQAGDLAHKRQNIDIRELNKLVNANAGKRGFTYTHHDTSNPHNFHAIRNANARGFTINLSANNPSHADKLARRDCGPVVTLLPADQLENTKTPAGRKIVVCPAMTGRTKDCASCGLCAIASRRTVIGFPAHGMRKRAASETAKQGT